MPQMITYQPTTDKFKIEFGATCLFPISVIKEFFPDSGLVGPDQAWFGPIWLDSLVCREEQWAKFIQFRRDAEKANPLMYHTIDRELNDFLLFSSEVRPQAPCVL